MLTRQARLTAKIGQHISLEGVIVGLLSVLYAPLLWYWVDGWLNKTISIQHEYFSHGLLGIPFAAYLCWEQRRPWQQLPNRLNPAGILLFVVALGFYGSGLLDLVNISLPLILVGLCLLLKGRVGLKLQAFPLVLVTLSTPSQLPYLIEPYTLPLQSFIASVAGFILLSFGLDVEVNQIYLTVNQRLVEVAPHCAGLKMLFTSLFMGLIITYWTGLNRSRLRTGLFFLGIVVISVGGNILRNTLLTFFHGTDRESAFHWLHESWGGDLYSALMLGLLIVLVHLLQAYVPSSLRIQSPQAPSEDTAVSSPATPYYPDNF